MHTTNNLMDHALAYFLPCSRWHSQRRASCFFLLLTFACLGPWTLSAQDGYSIAETNENWRVWQKTTWEPDAAGKMRRRVSAYTELVNGLYRRDDTGALVAASPVLELVGDCAVARQTRHQILFSPDANDWNGAVDCLLPDGQRLRSRVLGLSLFCPVTGKSALIAELKEHVPGQLLPGGTEVIYPDAFTDCQVDIRYRNRLGAFRRTSLSASLSISSRKTSASIPAPPVCKCSPNSSRRPRRRGRQPCAMEWKRIASWFLALAG